MKKWSVYILRCSDGTLYTGIATDIARRVREHDAGKGAKYTRGRGPMKLVWKKTGLSESAAKKREAATKRLSRKEKMLLIRRVI